MSIWKRDFTLEALNAGCQQSLLKSLGIELTEVHEDGISGTMPVDERTVQPMGLLHGGASVSLAESLGSVAANMAVDSGHYCVGLDINANHIRAARSGVVTGRAKALHLGRTTQVWDITITDDQGRLTCTSRLTMAVKKV